jgi:hypothetical protein
MNKRPDLANDQLAILETNAGGKRAACRWPAAPEWRSVYPSKEDSLQLAQLVEENDISTVYYRGLADEQVISAILKGNPNAQIVVWDYWGYWGVGTDDDGAESSEPIEQASSRSRVASELSALASELPAINTSERPWPWPKKQVIFQIEGSPHLFPDLFIMDMDHGAKEFCARTQAEFVVLAGLSRRGMDFDRYSWHDLANISVGHRRELSMEGMREAFDAWNQYFPNSVQENIVEIIPVETLDEAVDIVLTRLSNEDRNAIITGNSIFLHLSVGMWIRNHFGFNTGQAEKLSISISTAFGMPPTSGLRADEASRYILLAVGERLAGDATWRTRYGQTGLDD